RGFAGEPIAPKDPQQAYQQLLSIKSFAFGGVGYAGTTSQGELCFRALASSTNALQMFRAALTKGTTAGQLYALCGLRRLAPKDFDTAASPIIAANKTVTEWQGCLVCGQQASNIVARIKSGSYDSYIMPEKNKQ